MILNPPKLLVEDNVISLNNKLLEQTGCFAFLKTDCFLPSGGPSCYRDAFPIYVVTLYSLYHDYACQFLSFICDERSWLSSSPHCMNLNNAKKHLKIINQYLRPHIAHGIFCIEKRIFVQEILFNYLHISELKGSSANWPEFMISLSDQHWETIVRKLIEDSDQLYDLISLWGDEWSRASKNEREDLRLKFADSEFFKKSFDFRVCFSFAAKYIEEPNKGKVMSLLEKCQEQMVKKFKRELNCTPSQLLLELDNFISPYFVRSKKDSLEIAKRYDFDISHSI